MVKLISMLIEREIQGCKLLMIQGKLKVKVQNVKSKLKIEKSFDVAQDGEWSRTILDFKLWLLALDFKFQT